ncbi:MAG TPA: ATP-dependent zinc metalloprotease FtsH [Aggregatilineales bacterium]|nr:ATP-dependent zinc metalloprotease FtsH [Aggregatilineales bacterium]
MNSTRFRHGFVYLLIILAVAVIILGAFTRQDSPDSWSMTDVADAAKAGRISEIVVRDNNELVITLTDGDVKMSRKDANSTALEQLALQGVTPEQLAAIEWINETTTNWSSIFTILIYLLPLVFVVGFVYFMLRQAQGSNNQALSFGKSRARMFTGDQPTVTFDDVAGCDEAKEELREIVEFLREPAKFIQIGARIPKGVLLVGQPGTGKTLLAKAVSGEAGVPFFSISGSEFVEMFVGVGASRVRDLFEQAKRHSPCIIFIDEIDAVGRHRGAGLGGSHDEREQTLNQILVEMDGFDTDTNIIIIAATNRPDILDPALLRPGRFDRRVVLDRPDVRGREEILKVHVRGKPLAPNVELDLLARATPGFVGADIENMVNEAAILAARQNKKIIHMEDFKEAIERVVMGPERRSRLMSEEEKRITAYHEAGHAVVGHLLPFCDPVLKVTIIPRGMAGGYTMAVPEDDVRYVTRSKFMDDLAMMLGGRVAEELIFDDITTGASNDLERVTKLARNMVTRYGMSDRLGPMIYGQKEELVFLGREIGEQRDYSESVAEEIDAEVRRIVSTTYERARQVLTENADKLEAVAQALLEYETLDREAFLKIMEGETEEEAAEQSTGGTPSPVAEKGKQKAGKGDEDAPSALDLPPAPAPA